MILKLLVMALLLSLPACGCPGYVDYYRTDENFVTSHGIKVYPQGNMVAPEEIEQATEIFIWDIVLGFPCLYHEQEVREVISKVSLYIEKDKFMCVVRESGELNLIWCQGQCDIIDGTLKYANKCCIGDTAFVHELIHLLNYRIEGVNDYYHERRKFFGDRSGSLEHDTNQYIKDEICRCRCW